ncbi:7483_t:CDS:2 [Racocetra persica]|uniref:7483_t:CDS:1 n=1 Tax=Racocetra persica TaxID=160502 RepID=A0ACA9KB55_9GLOM|nr:7483_t:CDS:2 [Racocetra persica]
MDQNNAWFAIPRLPGKLLIVYYAERSQNFRGTARFDIQPKQVREWKSQKSQLQSPDKGS